MTILEAIAARHSVRKYSDQALEPEKIAALRGCVDHCNAEGNLHIQLVTDEPKSFAAGLWKYGQFAGVRNYFVMAAEPGKAAEERIGY
ncbi:MAG: nitroreductase, partial [Bacteroidales bacterium]|nr:nitroreductase [Bacteroidales bacterium]